MQGLTKTSASPEHNAAKLAASYFAWRIVESRGVRYAEQAKPGFINRIQDNGVQSRNRSKKYKR